MASKKYEYEINGTKYRLKPLKLGQVGQLLAEVGDDVEIMLDWSAIRIAAGLADRLCAVLAVVLIPISTKPEEKDINAIADEFAEHMEFATAVEIIADFLFLNRASLVFQNMSRIRNEFQDNRAKKTQSRNLSNSSAGSARETQAGAGKSSGH